MEIVQKVKLNFKKKKEKIPVKPDEDGEGEIRDLGECTPFIDELDVADDGYDELVEVRTTMTATEGGIGLATIEIIDDANFDTGRINVPENWKELDPKLVDILREGLELDESIERLEGSIACKDGVKLGGIRV